MVSHKEVIDNYFYASDREHYRKGVNVFFEDDTLFSHGYHFILAQKVKNGYILNGDRYSTSTDKHQSITRSKAPQNSSVIPFSALRSAGVEFNLDKFNKINNIRILDVSSDTWEVRRVKNKKTGNMKKKIYIT